MLIDAGGRTIAQTASRENGTYSVTAPAPGSYRAQVLQIGWRPTIAGPFALRAGVSTTANIDVTGARIPLDAIVITDRSDCRVRPDSAASAFILWDEARKALTAAMMTRAEPLTMSLSRTEQNLDRTGSRVLWDSTKVQVGQSLNPFFSLAPELLAERGYMSADAAGNKTYWGPDATVMLSESFLSSHCIRPEKPSSQSGDSARLIGVAFAPVAKRRGIVDVEGVVWLDRSTCRASRDRISLCEYDNRHRARRPGRPHRVHAHSRRTVDRAPMVDPRSVDGHGRSNAATCRQFQGPCASIHRLKICWAFA